MTEKKYLKRFKRLLKVYKIKNSDDILLDIEAHFEAKHEKGQTDEEIIVGLGTPEQNFYEYIEKNQLHEHCKKVNKKRILTLCQLVSVSVILIIGISLGSYFWGRYLKSKYEGPFNIGKQTVTIGTWDTQTNFSLYAICDNKIMLKKHNEIYSIPSWDNKTQFYNQTQNCKLFFVQSSFRRKDEEKTTIFRGYIYTTRLTECQSFNFDDNSTCQWVKIDELPHYSLDTQEIESSKIISKINFNKISLYLKKVEKVKNKKEYVNLINNNGMLDLPCISLNLEQISFVDKEDSTEFASTYICFDYQNKSLEFKAHEMLLFQSEDELKIAYILDDVAFNEKIFESINSKFDTTTAFTFEENDMFVGYTKLQNSKFDEYIYSRYGLKSEFNFIF